jgi:DNA-binding XRE family transcriptional regulator
MRTKETFGLRLQRLRIAAGLTQKELARLVGAPVLTLVFWEGDRREPGFRAAVRLARALRTTVEHLADTVPAEDAEKRKPRPMGPTLRSARTEKPAGKQGKKRSRH